MTYGEKKHTTTKSWRPNMNGQFDPNKGYYHIETSPNGTDPNTAKTHFILYNLTFIQTKTLHTSAIGSFHIFATLDSIKNCTAQINIWMYNKMSRESFGKFAQHSYFSESYMHDQYMWWNWKEKVTIDKNWRIH